MNTPDTISIGKILWKVLNNPFASGITYDDAAEYATEAIRLLGAPALYDNKFAEVTINENKGRLPSGILNIRQVRNLDNNMAFREATATFHKSKNFNEATEYTYEVKNGIIFTSIKEGCVEVAYKGLLTDEVGYPLIVDNQKLKLAIEYYILDRFLEPLWMMGKLTDKAYNKISQERHFYMASASNNLQMPSMDEMASMTNGLNRLLQNDRGHSTLFENYGSPEQIKRYT